MNLKFQHSSFIIAALLPNTPHPIDVTNFNNPKSLEILLAPGTKTAASPWCIGVTVFGGTRFRVRNYTEVRSDYYCKYWLFGGIGLVLSLFIARCRYEYLLKWHQDLWHNQLCL